MSSLDLRMEEPEIYSSQVKHLFSILHDYLQPKTVTTLQYTAASIVAILPKRDIGSTEVWMFGELCIQLAEQIPYYHPLQLKLVALVDYLQLCPQLFEIFEDREVKKGKLNQALGTLTGCTTLLQGKSTGHYLRHSRLGESMRDNLNGNTTFFPSTMTALTIAFETGPDPENPGYYVNFHAFAANIQECRVLGGDFTWAIWVLREAHEDICMEEGEFRQLVRDELILAAAQWILWCGQSLFKQVLFREDIDPNLLAKAWCTGKLYHGEGGLSMDRWRFWRNGFEGIAAGARGEKEGYGEECVRVAARAAVIMKTLEESMTF